MSDFLKGVNAKSISSFASDPFKATSDLVKGKLFPKGEGPFGDGSGSNTGINEFRDAIMSDGLQRSNRFLAHINFPDAVVAKVQPSVVGASKSRHISLKVLSVDIPSKSITQHKMLANGQPYNIGIDFEYGELLVTFIVGQNHKEIMLFNEWMNQVFSTHRGSSNYYKNYISDELRVYPLDKRDNQNFVYIFEDVYPMSMDISNFSNEEKEGYTTVSVNFSFRRFMGDNQNIKSPLLDESAGGFADDVIGGLRSASKVLGALDNGFSKLESLKNKFK